MIKFYLYITSLLLSTAVIADGQTEDTRAILKANLPRTCNFSGTFIQHKHLQGLPAPLASSGDFLFACQYGLVWDTNKPSDETRIYTTENLHFSIHNSQEPLLLEGIANFYLAKFLLSILSGNIDKLYKSYEIKVQQTKPLSVTLTPKNKYLKKGLKTIELLKTVTNSDQQITVKITDANAQTTEIQVKEEQQHLSEDIIKMCSANYAKETCSVLEDPSEYEQSQALY